MKYSFDISSFLRELSSLSLSVVFLYFFALFIEEGLCVSPCYSLELCIQLSISFPFLLYLLLLFFPQLIVSLLRQLLCLLAFLWDGFGLAFCVVLQTSIHGSSGTLSPRSNHLNLFVSSTL